MVPNVGHELHSGTMEQHVRGVTVWGLNVSHASQNISIYRIMPYTSAGREGTTSRRSLFRLQEESIIISNTP